MKLKDIALALLVILIWGCNFVFAKYAVMHFGALMTMGIRLALVGALLIPFTKIPRISKKDMFKISFINGILHHGFIFTAIGSTLNIGTIVVLNQINVPFSSILAYILLKDQIKIRRMFGIIVSFIGVFIVFGVPELSKENIAAIFCVVMGALTMAITNIEIKKLGNFDALPFLGWISLMASPFLILLSLIMEPFEVESFQTIPLEVYLSFGYMMISSIIGYGIWFSLLQKYSVNLMAPFTLLTPIVGMIAAAGILKEEITQELILGALITLIGVAIIIIRRPDYINKQQEI